MDSQTYVFMPLFALTQSVLFWGAGLSLLTTRFVPILAGAVTIALTFQIGRKNFRFDIALLAAVLLLGWRIAGPLSNRLFGIPLIDTARVARYDALVPVFGLLAWAVYQSAVRGNARRRWALAVFLAGLAGLTHVYGIFWLAVLLLLAWRDKLWRQSWPFLLLGFALPWSAYFLYAALGFENWRQQFGVFASTERFSPFDPLWYGRNLLREPLRYLPTLSADNLAALMRPGVVLLLAGLPAAVFWLWRHGKRQGRTLLIPLLLLPLLFGLLISPKVPAYLMAFWPVVTLALAYLILEGAVRVGGWRRAAALVLLALVLVEGGRRLAQTRTIANQNSSYAAYTGAIEQNLPPQGLVLGLQRTWLGLAERDYRSWSVPIFSRTADTPGALVEVVNQLQPTAVIIDPDMSAYFAERPAEWRAVEQWLAESGFSSPAIVDDPTYGRTAVYSRPANGLNP
jgi:hypothetical protein